VTWRPDRRASAQTSLQLATLRFGAFLDSARLELTEREYAFLEILTARIAREHRLRLERDELQRRRAA
jgi:hypothetical protein